MRARSLGLMHPAAGWLLLAHGGATTVRRGGAAGGCGGDGDGPAVGAHHRAMLGAVLGALRPRWVGTWVLGS